MTAFIFDMDGTIVDNMSFHLEAWRAFFAERGINFGGDGLWAHITGRSSPETLRAVLGEHLSDELVASYSDDKERIYRAIYRPHLRPIAGLERFLSEARQLGVSMALATSAGRVNIEFVVGGLGIGPFFSAIVGSDDVPRGKPHPDLFLTAAQRLAVRAGDCLVFEDSLSGIEAAGRAGMRAVAITTAHAASELSAPSVVRVIRDYTSLDPASLREWATSKYDWCCEADLRFTAEARRARRTL